MRNYLISTLNHHFHYAVNKLISMCLIGYGAMHLAFALYGPECHNVVQVHKDVMLLLVKPFPIGA